MLDRLVALLPCYSLESFDLRQNEADSGQLLSAWSALWHPLLLATARTIPRWQPATSPPQVPAGHLIIVPECSEASLPEGWLAQAEASEACVLRHQPDRAAMLAAILERVGPVPETLDPLLEAEFLALGLCHFQVELLTRKLRYMSTLDEGTLQTALLAAADEALKGESEAARRHLQTAFDRLHDAREYFYPTEPRLLDLTLLAPTTVGESLRAELAESLPSSLLVAGEVLDVMAQREPATLEALKKALAENRVALIGGERVELPLPLLSPDAIEAHLRRGLAVYERHLGQRPKTFGRRRFGLTPVLPQILERLGFTGMLHCTLDDGQFPTGKQSRLQWEGVDGTTIEAVARLPLDASRAESFFQLTETLGQAMNLDQAAAVVLAHWPGRASLWYDDLRRVRVYGSVLGSFVTMDAYLEKTLSVGQRGHYKPDQYRSPYLVQDVAAERRDPITRWVRFFHRQAALEACRTLDAMARVCGGEPRVEDAGRNAEELDAAIDASLGAEDTADGLEDRLAAALQEPLARVARAVCGRSSSEERGILAVNPWSFAQQATVLPSSLAAGSSPPVPCPVRLDVPSMGFAWCEPKAPTPVAEGPRGWFGRRKSPAPPMADENMLRNEFFQVHFDPQTGAIRAMADYHSRSPRLAQQIAMRLPHGGEPDADINYSIMAADELVVASAGPQRGEIVCRGRLMDREGHRVARFQQTTRAWRGSRILEIEINLDIDRQPGPVAWDSYYAVRFAWKDDAAVLLRSTGLANLPTERTQFESPDFVDIRCPKHRTTLLTGGLPYHRRLGLRKLDTLLVVQGETGRSFRLGIGIDVPHPTAAAMALIAPPLVLPDQPRPASPSGWLFHLDCRNVLATGWQPLAAKEHSPELATPGSRQPPGFRVHLLETDGHSVKLGLRCLRSVASAVKINPGDVPPLALAVEGDRVDIPMGPHQRTEIEVRFAS